ncbi:MAG: PhnA domain-containing protein [Sulfuricurvum sp.]|nr:PhnA domain-containing protein [Sulfuricurvum sp.]
MSIQKILVDRSNHQCELCASTENLDVLNIGDGSIEQSLYACDVCRTQIAHPETLDPNHWRCLNDSMWSETPAVQVISYRLLQALGNQELLDMIYLENDIKAWADSVTLSTNSTEEAGVVIHRDSNGTVLAEGDTVTLIKDLDVKGAGFTAKRGTIVKNIHLTDDAKFIEGKINGTQIVLVSAYMKKSL